MPTMITPVEDHIYVLPVDEEYTAGGIALPQRDREEPGTLKGRVFAYSLGALQRIISSIGPDKRSLWGEGVLIEYFGHSTTRVDGVEFHVIKPRDVWSILTPVESGGAAEGDSDE